MQTRPTTILPLDLFTWDRDTATLYAEASDLKAYPGAIGQLYPDAADVGLTIQAEYGKTVRFVEDGSTVSAEDGVIEWQFTPIDSTGVEYVRILND